MVLGRLYTRHGDVMFSCDFFYSFIPGFKISIPDGSSVSTGLRVPSHCLLEAVTFHSGIDVLRFGPSANRQNVLSPPGFCISP